MIDLPFNNLAADEMSMFLAVCCECKRQGNNLVKIDLLELEQFGAFSAYAKQRLNACVESMYKKLLKFYFVCKDDKHYECFTLFTRLNIYYENDFIEIFINEPFVSLLNVNESRLVYALTELIKDSKLDDSELDLNDMPF